MKKIVHFLSEHAMIFVVSAIVLVALILATIIFILASSGNTQRKITVEDISGSAFILKNDGQVPANKNMNLESGDVIITSSDGSVKLTADKDKYIYIEPDTTLYVYYTDSSEKGSIVVNISEGAAICRIDSKLSKNAAFEVRTPNAVISAAGTVFRTDFSYLDSYGGYSEVKITEVQCSEGETNVQLYDDNAAPVEKLMLLAEGKSARLMTCTETTRYEYLNNDTDISSMPLEALKNFIRIAAERNISYPLSTLNSAYQNALSLGDTVSSTLPETSEAVTETSASVTSAPTETTSSEPVTTDVSSVTSDTETETTSVSESTAISVTSPTTRVYEVTTVPTTDKTVSETFTSPPPVSETTSETIPPIKPAETVTASAEQSRITETEETENSVTETEPSSQSTSNTTSPTIPWWEIINSSALNSGNSHN